MVSWLSWAIEYANQSRAWVEQCLFEAKVELHGFTIEVDLYVEPLGTYDIILCMNWLGKHKARVNCYDKTIECLNYLGNKVLFQGTRHEVKLWQLSTIQLKQSEQKGCQMFAIKMEEINESNEIKFHDDMMIYETSYHHEKNLGRVEVQRNHLKIDIPIFIIIRMCFLKNYWVTTQENI